MCMHQSYETFTNQETDILQRKLRFIEHYPRPKTSNLDITPLLGDVALNEIAYYSVRGLFGENGYDTIVAPEGEGWIYAQPIALKYHKRLVTARRLNGCPYRATCEVYPSSHGNSLIEIPMGELGEMNRVLIVNNVLATRQMTSALIRLVQRTGAKVIGVAALASLDYLAQAKIPDDIPVRAVLSYDELPLG